MIKGHHKPLWTGTCQGEEGLGHTAALKVTCRQGEKRVKVSKRGGCLWPHHKHSMHTGARAHAGARGRAGAGGQA